MSYTKTTWVNNQPPYINADNLNKIENGIETNANNIEALGDLQDLKTTATNFTNAINEVYDMAAKEYTYDSTFPAELHYIKIGNFIIAYGTVIMNVASRDFTLKYTPATGGTYPTTGIFSSNSSIASYGNVTISKNSKTAYIYMNAATTRAVVMFCYLTND